MNKQDIQEVHRLTPLQQGMLFHTLEAPGSGVYVEQFACPAAGRIDGARWQAAWNMVLGACPVLRAAIAWEGLEHPLLVVTKLAAIDVVEIDATDDDDTAFAARLDALRRDEAARGFDLRRPPLLRQALLHREDRSVVFWTYHHVLLDGWSAFVVLGSLLSAYAALTDGAAWQPRPVPGWGDYLGWLRGRDKVAAQDYWRGQMEGFHAPTPLGLVKRPAPDSGADAGATATGELGEALGNRLRETARALRVTPGTLLQAAWAHLLALYSGEDDVVFGATVAGRPPELAGADAMVGLFINTVPVRVRIDPAETVRGFATRLGAALVAQREHEHASLTEIAGWSEVPRGRALFDSMVAIESFPYTEGFSLPDVSVWQHTNFPLALVIDPVGRMRTKALYDARQFDGSAVAGLLAHYRALLSRMVADVDLPVGMLTIAPDDDMALQDAWNHRPAVNASSDLGELFARQVAERPDAPAIVSDEGDATYAQLDLQARRLGARLLAAGVRAGDTVAFAFEPGVPMIAALVAITRLGCAYAPLDVRLPAARLAQMVTDLHIRHVVTDGAHAALFDIAGVLVLLGGDDENDVPLKDWPAADPARILYVIHTSGSTGKPKAAGVFHDSFTRFIGWWNDEFTFAPGERCLLVNKITFDLAQKCVWGALTTGGILHLAPTRHFDPLHAREQVAGHGIGWINCTPSMAYAMVEADAGRHDALASLRLLFVGGEPVDKRRLAPWLLSPACKTALVNTYGPTECTDLCTTHRFGRDEFVDLEAPVTVGCVLPGLAVHVLDRFGNRLPVGVTGEVAIAGGSVGAGYLNNAQMSAQKFLPDPDRKGARLYLTGDLGYYRADGTLVVHGRVDFQVKLRGYRIELDAIGHELRGHPAVLDAVAAVTPDGQRLIAYVVPEGGAAWTPALQEACRAWLAARLPEYMVPACYMPLAALPLNANGKLDRGALPAPDMSNADTVKIAPRDDIEARLAGIWAAVLGTDDFGVTDNFFDLGGHSLSITQAYARLQKTFGVRIPLSVLFEQPTIAGQAAALREAGADGADGAKAQAAARQPAITAGQRPERLPLSFSQSRLWFLHQYEPASMAYHVPNALPLAGTVDRVALQGALDWLHARHESLRTRYPEADGTPWQEVLAPAPVALGYDDLRGAPDAAGRLSAIATAEAAQPFDLRAGPVARYRLVQGDDRAILLVSLHHIATDGWSMDVMMRELSSAYAAFAAGGAPQTAPLPIQYADYALWQRADLAGDKRARLVDYWRAELDGSQPQITLPYDFPRPAARSSSGGLHVSHIPADICAALRGVANSGSTAFMTWLALYDVLLHRWSGQTDFNVGSPIANRNLEETEGVIGFFVNTLVLRARMEGGQTFAGLLDDVRRTARAAYDHAELPFELLVDELNPPRSANTLPFFQVGFALQRAYEDTSLIDTTEWISRFDLQLVLYESADGGLRAHWEYARDLFLPETVARLADSFALLARQVAEAPATPLRNLAVVDGATREKMLALARGVKPALPETSVHGLFAQQALLAPGNVALVQGELQLDYDELNRRANRLAHHLLGAGVAPGGIVGVALPRSPQLIVALLAVLKAGCAYLPLDTEYPRERTAYMLANAGAVAVLTNADGAALLPAFDGAVLDVDAPQVAAQRDANPDVPHDPRALAYVMYTSGTTGKPKGVMIEHRSIVRLVREADYADFSADRTYLQYAPVGFDASTFEIWGSLLNGARLVQAPAGVVGLDQLAGLIAGERIDTAFVTAALFNQLVDQHPEALAGVRQLLTGGEAMSSPHAARAIEAMQAGSGGQLIHVYGPTECTTFATAGNVSMAAALAGTVPIGRPIAHTDTYVLDDAMEPVPCNVPGELYIGGAGVARGYLNAPQQSAERFVADPFGGEGASAGARLYRTGDKVRWKADGTLEFLGRMDDQVKIRGYRIEPAEIEAQLATCPGVGGALVLALGDSADKRLVAYVTLADADSSVTPSLLRDYLAQRLPAFMVPGAYVLLDRFPVTANGKVDRRALPLPDADALGAGDYVAPETALEQSIALVWGEMLGLERVSVTADFFALGGNSLTATQLLARVRASLGHTVTLPEFFSEPTVRAMAFRIEHADTARAMDAAESHLDGEAESALVLPEPLPPLASSLEHVLLTGATGFVGAYVAAEMLDRWPRVTLHCHVRAAHPAAGLRRLRDNLDQYGLWKEGYAARIRVLTGDLADPKLGLDDDHYATLAHDVDLVVHNASRLNHVLPYQALRRDNVEPTRGLLELAATAKRKGFVLVSTAGVLQGENGGTFDEDVRVEEIGQSVREGYNASKWVSELMVRRAARAGIPVQIMRLGRVVLDSRSGTGRMDDFVALFVRTCLKVGAWPDRPFVEQFVPVDHVARAITALAADYTSTGVHHLVGDEKRDWSRLLPDFVDCAGAGLQRMPIRDWVDAVKERSAVEPLPFSPYLFWWDTDAAAPEEKRLKVKQAKTVRRLAGHGLREPRIETEAWQRYVGDIFATEGVAMTLKKRGIFG